MFFKENIFSSSNISKSSTVLLSFSYVKGSNIIFFLSLFISNQFLDTRSNYKLSNS